MRILFVYGSLASFTKADLETLRSAHEVRALHFRRDPLHFVPSVIAAVRDAAWADAIVSWFGTIHALPSFLAGRLLGRPCVVIAGGYDVAREPAIGYGNMLGGVRRLIGKTVFALAHRVLAFSQFAGREAIANARVPPARVEVIPLGVADVPRVQPEGVPSTRRSVLTVSIVNQSNLSRKGLTTFVKTARLLPDVPFVLVGPFEDGAIDRLRAAAPPNLEITGWLSTEEVRARMEAAAVYVQASFHEAFGVAVAEAMLCRCVPVVTDRGSLPEVVGDTGFYVPVADPAATAQAVREALAHPERGAQARHWVLRHFPPALRRERLLAALPRAQADGGPTAK